MRILLSVSTILFAAAVADADGPKKLLLLHQKPDGHPPTTHEYLAGQKILQKLLAEFKGLETTLVAADEPWTDGPELLAKADGVVVFVSEGAKWLSADAKRLAAFQALAKRGGGLSVLHWGMGTKDEKNIAAFVDLFGGCHGGPERKYKVLKTAATFPNPKHAIALGLKPFEARDEFYYRLHFAKNVEPMLRVDIDGQPETVAWAWRRPEGGRSFGFSGFHFHENWNVDEYRRLATRGVAWSMEGPGPRAD